MWRLFFLYAISVFAASIDEEDLTLFHHVNVITGNLNLSFQDFYVPAAVPIALNRAYTSSGMFERKHDLDLKLKTQCNNWLIQGGWSVLPHAHLFIVQDKKHKRFRLFLQELSGSHIGYTYTHHEDHRFYFSPDPKNAQYTPQLGAIHDVRNNQICLHVDTGKATLTLPDGTIRYYEGEKLKRPKAGAECVYQLVKETLPSQHHIRYLYDHKNRLIEYHSLNPSETRTYAKVFFHLDNTHLPYRFQATSSHGQHINYQALDYKEREYLHDVVLNHQAPQHFDYEAGGRGLGARLVQMLFGKEVQFNADYYDRDHEHADKIAALKAPKGLKGEMVPLAKFTYKDNVTNVIDIEGIQTRYHYNDDQLYKIEYFNKSNQIERKTRLFWNDHRLKAKVACDAQGKAFFGKKFTYDGKGNVLTETISGNLTGQAGDSFLLDKQGNLLNAESLTTTYTYLPRFNVPVWIHEEDGLSVEHQYLPKTNLLTAKLTYHQDKIFQRSFCVYDDNNLVKEEILDDGTTPDSKDLCGVTQRSIRRYQRHSKHGLPIEITDLYLEHGEEHLLRRQVIAYSEAHEVASVAIYDSNNAYCYTLYSEYDRHGNLTSQTTPLGATNTFTYDKHHRYLTSKEVGAPEKKISYAPNGSPLSCTELDEQGDIQTATTHFDSKGRLLRLIDPEQNTTSHTYDAFGRCLSTQDACGAVTTCAYNELGHLTTITDPLGATTHTEYTTYDKPSKIIHPDGTITTHRYDKKGRLIKTIDPDGKTTTYAYDPLDRPVHKHLYDSSGSLIAQETWTYSTFHLLSHTNYRGETTTYTYDGAGRKIAEQTGDLITEYSYDTLGNLICTRVADSASHLIYDLEGRVVSSWQTQGDHVENYTHFFYDHEGRKSRAERHTDEGLAVDTFTYDRLSHLASHTDPDFNTTYFIYHSALKQETIDPLGNRTIDSYDACNRKVRTEKQDAHGTMTFLEESQYDLASHLIRQMSYPMRGEPHVLEWEYDVMGRPILLTESSSKRTHYTYHASGKIATKTLPSGIVLSFDYDPLLRLRYCASSDGQINYSYEYTADHLELDLTDHATGISLHQTFDNRGQLLHEIDSKGKEMAWQYDAQGRRIRFQLPDHSSIEYAHQGCHLIRLDRLDPSGCVIYHHEYTAFDPTGRLKESNLPAHLGTLKFSYDKCERSKSCHSSWARINNSYDAAHRLIRQENSLLSDKDYAYDPLHQLIQEGLKSYSFDALGNPTDGLIGPANQLLHTPEYDLQYDLDGQPLSKSSSNDRLEFTFDPLGRLTSITSTHSKTLYRYDPLSRLYDKTLYTQIDGVWQLNDYRTYLYDQEIEIGTMQQDKIIELKIIGIGVAPDIGATVAIEIDHVTFVPIHDLQGNPIALLNLQGSIVETYELSAFGEELPLDYINPWRFQSKRTERGFVFFGERFYDPTLHRWLSPDPADFADTVNLYLFVRNAPQNRLDLFGLTSFDRIEDTLKMEVPIHCFIPPPAASVLIHCKGSAQGILVDWVLSCGHWHLLKFTPEELRTGIVNIAAHFHELIPTTGNMISLVTAQNGVFNSFGEFKDEMCQAIVDKIPEGTFFIGIHNPSGGLIQTACNLSRGYRLPSLWFTGGLIGLLSPCLDETTTIVKTRAFFNAMNDGFRGCESTTFWYHIMHSEGGLIGSAALSEFYGKQREFFQNKLIVLGLGPADLPRKDWVKDTRNVYSCMDLITGWRGFTGSFFPKTYNVEFLPCISTPETEDPEED